MGEKHPGKKKEKSCGEEKENGEKVKTCALHCKKKAKYGGTDL